jgi:two-component system, NarL family, sensor histidine kinase DevS
MNEADAVTRNAVQRLHALVAANRSIVSELSLSGVLRRIVGAAREVVDAQYAALGVLGSGGTLEQFLHVGMDAASVLAVGPLPQGRGLLGALLADPRPVRLERLDQDPRSVGFPEGHPVMTSFLGVPVRTRNAVFGSLYLTNRGGGEAFTEEDEELVLALAASAGTAIENARLYEQAQQRQQWLQAVAEVDEVLLKSHLGEPEVLPRIAAGVQRLTGADVVVVVLPSATEPEELVVVAAAGATARLLSGRRWVRTRSVAGRALELGRGVRVDADRGLDPELQAVVPLARLMAVPMTGEAGVRGAVVAGRVATTPFTDAELELAGTFSVRAALALELADARAAQQRVNLLEGRGQIAHELHDHVIQRLFATGLSMQSVVMGLPDGELRDRTSTAVDDLDATIVRIQAAISALRDPAGSYGLRR